MDILINSSNLFSAINNRIDCTKRRAFPSYEVDSPAITETRVFENTSFLPLWFLI